MVGTANPGRPIIMVCAASASVRDAVVDQLESRYSAAYTVQAADTVPAALGLLRAAAAAGTQVAILLADDPTEAADHRTVFQSARELFPDVRRGLLVEWGAWGDPDTADSILRLMAAGQIDYYVIRPWHSPDEYFHRTVTEFLVEWDRAIGTRPREVSVVADPLTARSHELRSLLARGGIPHSYHPTGSPEARALLEAAGADPAESTVVLLHDGRVLVDPTNAELAQSYGLLDRGARGRGLRPRRGRCRAGRPRGRRLRRVGGPAHPRRGVRGHRRPGRVELSDPQLPRLLAGDLGRRAHAAGLPAGLGVRLLVRACPPGEVDRVRRRRARGRRGTGPHGFEPAPWCWPRASPTGRLGVPELERLESAGDLLRGIHLRGEGTAGTDRARGGGRQLRRAGRPAPRPVRARRSRCWCVAPRSTTPCPGT